MQEATATAAAPARTATIPPNAAKGKAGRPVGRPSGSATAANTATTIAVTPTPEQRETLAEWARVKATTPEALVQAAFETMMADVDRCVAEYRAMRADFDRDAVARIERGEAR